ncbi:MAG: U32 family peptidase, partial [Raoultibacter sp.]
MDETFQKPELLAPAGGFDQLRYAIYFGADAVYLAADRFGLRQRATNFALDQIPAAVAYAHQRGVQVHLTCNALMDAHDLEALPPYLEALAAAGVDALIISDLGALRLAKKYAPG